MGGNGSGETGRDGWAEEGLRLRSIGFDLLASSSHRLRWHEPTPRTQELEPTFFYRLSQEIQRLWPRFCEEERTTACILPSRTVRFHSRRERLTLPRRRFNTCIGPPPWIALFYASFVTSLFTTFLAMLGRAGEGRFHLIIEAHPVMFPLCCCQCHSAAPCPDIFGSFVVPSHVARYTSTPGLHPPAQGSDAISHV